MTASPDVLESLVSLLERLYRESADYLDKPQEQQLWYNRGYANGMAAALQALGHGELLQGRVQPDNGEAVLGFEAMAWGKAYTHGLELGRRETREVMARLDG